MSSATGPKNLPMIVRQADRDIISVRDALGIATPAPVVLISGGADTFDPAILPKLTQLIGRGLIRAGRTAGAVFIACFFCDQPLATRWRMSAIHPTEPFPTGIMNGRHGA